MPGGDGRAEWPCWRGESAPPFPVGRRDPVEELRFGERVPDPYRWLETRSARTRAWVDAQQDATRAALEEAALPAAVRARLRDLRHSADAPVARRTRAGTFFAARPEGAEREAIFRRRAGGAPEPILDSNDFPANVTLGRWSPSPDGRWILFQETRDNSDAGPLYVWDVEAASLLEGGMMSPELPFFTARWAADSSGFYYERPGVALLGGEIVWHVLGTSIGEDVVVSTPPAREGQSVTLWEPRAGERLLRVGSVLYRQDLETSGRAERAWESWVEPGDTGRFFSYSGPSDALVARELSYVHPFGQALRARPGSSAAEWEVLVPERLGAPLLGVLETRRAGVLALHLVDGSVELSRWVGGELAAIAPLPPFGSAQLLGEAADGRVRVRFSSWLSSPRVWRWDWETGALEEEAPELGGRPIDLDPTRFEQRFFFAPSTPGVGGEATPVGVLLTRPAGAPRDGSTPLLLEAYGGFRVSWTARFSPRAALWLERGGAVAIAQVRGGGEQGVGWWAAAVGVNKPNTYADVHAVAQELILRGETSSARLAFQGGSNGGLTASVAATQRPDLYGAIVAEAPLTDMLRYPLFEIGASWVSEYGDPELAEEFRALLDYSPYHRAEREGCVGYPSVMLTVGEADDRVAPLHAWKMAATLQRHTRRAPVRLYTAPRTSHTGSAYRSEALAYDEAVLTFLADRLGLPLEAR